MANEHNVAYHKWYIVSGPVGGTVTNEDGSVTYCTIPEGGQGHFFSVTTKVWVSEETVELDQDVNFKGASRMLRLLAGGVKKDLELSFIALTKQLVTDFYVTSAAAPQGMHFAFRLDSRAAGAWLNVLSWYKEERWTKRVNLAGTKYGMPDDKFIVETRQNGLEDGSIDKFAVIGNVYEVNWLAGTRSVTINGEIFYANQWGDAVNDTDLNIPVNLGTNGAQISFYFARYFYNNEKVIDLKPFLSAQGKPYFANLSTNNNLSNEGMIAGFTLKQARKLGKHLPEGGGSLTVSLPYEAQLVQYNAEVEASLETAKSKGWTITVQYREPEEDSVLYTKYAACKIFDHIKAVNANYMQDLTVNGEWKWELPLYTGGGMPFYFGSVKVWLVDLPQMLSGANMFYQNKPLTRFKGALPKMGSGWAMFYNCYNMTSFESEVPALSEGTNMFHMTKLDKASALRVLLSIPAYSSGTYNLTLGIHVDHQTDDEVVEAIAEAEEKGWTLAVQWNGTPGTSTASTYGLRRKPVYAKLGEPMEDGNQRLDWGHYVTNWAENGYQEFSSLEEAQEHFNIGE